MDPVVVLRGDASQCSFCGASLESMRVVVKGERAGICDRCVERVARMVAIAINPHRRAAGVDHLVNALFRPPGRASAAG